MLKTLEKSWPIISIVFTLLILASLFFLPGATRVLSLAVMFLGIIAILTFTVRRHVQAHRQGRITRPAMRRNIIIDLFGLLITMAIVILVAGMAGTSAVLRLAQDQAAGQAWGMTWGVLAGLLAGIAAGVLVSLFVRWGWGKLWKLGKVKRTAA